MVMRQLISFNTEGDQNLIPAKQGDLFVFYKQKKKNTEVNNPSILLQKLQIITTFNQ